MFSSADPQLLCCVQTWCFNIAGTVLDCMSCKNRFRQGLRMRIRMKKTRMARNNKPKCICIKWEQHTGMIELKSIPSSFLPRSVDWGCAGTAKQCGKKFITKAYSHESIFVFCYETEYLSLFTLTMDI